MHKLESSEGFYITGRGPCFIVDSIPEEITDLRQLTGMHVLINNRANNRGYVEYEIRGVEMFACLDGHLRVEGPQSLLVREVNPSPSATLSCGCPKCIDEKTYDFFGNEINE